MNWTDIRDFCRRYGVEVSQSQCTRWLNGTSDTKSIAVVMAVIRAERGEPAKCGEEHAARVKAIRESRPARDEKIFQSSYVERAEKEVVDRLAKLTEDVAWGKLASDEEEVVELVDRGPVDAKNGWRYERGILQVVVDEVLWEHRGGLVSRVKVDGEVIELSEGGKLVWL